MKTYRLFSGTNSDLLQAAIVIHRIATEDFSHFEGFSSKFNQEFLDEFQSKIDTISRLETHSNVLTQQVTKTKSVKEALQNAQKIYRKAKLYAELAFMDEETSILKAFSKGYLDARKSQAKMIVFLDELHRTIQQHYTKLIDANLGGMPKDFPEIILNVRETLQQANTIQEDFINTKKTASQERLQALNECYKHMMMYNSAAQIIFEHNSAKRKMYSYKHRTSKTRAKETGKGLVAANSYKTVAQIPYESNRSIQFENLGDVPLLFVLISEKSPNDASSLAGNRVNLETKSQTNQSMQWLNASLNANEPSKLVVYNPSSNIEGKFSVTFL